ncbi:MAG TPA: hypothetical protein VN158_13595, partial [Caulobacter sp.]|nr:hypothetical protein [Caulobacter sp.]
MSGLTGLIAGLVLAIQQAPPPAPYPDPSIWWSPDVPRPPPELEPLYNRRPGRDEQPIPIDNGVPPLLYRLWGLQPLQSQVLKRGELILEVWGRPTLARFLLVLGLDQAGGPDHAPRDPHPVAIEQRNRLAVGRCLD